MNPFYRIFYLYSAFSPCAEPDMAHEVRNPWVSFGVHSSPNGSDQQKKSNLWGGVVAVCRKPERVSRMADAALNDIEQRL